MYFLEFLERMKNKSFIKNLTNYSLLTEKEKLITISSLLTHLLIDSKDGIENKKYVDEILYILTQLILYKNDIFIDFLEKELNVKE